MTIGKKRRLLRLLQRLNRPNYFGYRAILLDAELNPQIEERNNAPSAEEAAAEHTYGRAQEIAEDRKARLKQRRFTGGLAAKETKL